MTNRKEKVLSLIQSKGMYKVMNSTKWQELKKGVAGLPFEPPLIIKAIGDTESEYRKFDDNISYASDWGLYLDGYLGGDINATPYYAIEYIKVKPQLTKHRGHLISPEIIDESQEFLPVLEEYNIPFEQSDGVYIIYGYRSINIA